MGQTLSKRWSRTKCCTCVEDVNQNRRTPQKVDDSHKTQTSSWLPPRENWQDASGLPYGWETAVDGHQKPYFINLVLPVPSMSCSRSNSTPGYHAR
ncbi:hypothetical protein RRG08_050215 [Elysia crispata]|uniref:WW domain-containing protein n=1 Tax=Elysia crispata TaxID=231223 RepID=A0AAE0Z7Q7_9GAST|nr:hypothetical protein RRG08_050215 [Elysia crispata]